MTLIGKEGSNLMFPTQSEKSAVRIAGRRLGYAMASILIALPAWTADKAKDEETMRNAATVLQAMVDSKTVPADVLSRADCVIVLPSVKKGGFIVGGSGGRGPMSCRQGPNFAGAWSTPAMFTIGGASVGLQVGGSSTDFVLLIMSQKGADAIMNGKTELGHDATVAAGPAGATAAGTTGSDVLTYGRAKGLFAGASLGGASLEPDNDANKRLYGRPINAREILMMNTVQPTPGGRDFVNRLNSNIGTHATN